MTLQAIIGQKMDQSQKFLEDGTRIPVTQLWVKGNVVAAVKTNDKHNYSAIQLGFGQKKKANKAQIGQIKGASLKAAPKFLKEVRLNEEDSTPNLGEAINASEIFKPGDMINVTGVSKGKGYAGVVKRHHFKGGPRTHGQSDRERAPGSIGQTTTPGRVYKGKRMAGRMGHETATIRNLEVMDVSADLILVKGLVPGGRNTLIMVKKVGENKKFVPLYKEIDGEESAEQLAHAEGDTRQKEEKPTEDSGSLSEIQPKEIKDESMEKSGTNFSSPSDDQSPSALETFSSSESGSAPSTSDNDIKDENNEDKKEDKENAG